MTAPRPVTSRLGRAALAYAEQGWHVFPLTPRAKTPLIKGGGGFLAATADLDRVAAWWRGQPEANIGLWPGQSGLCVVDLDGPAALPVAQRFGVLAEPTLECQTGRPDGGRHLYFRRPDFTVSNGHPVPDVKAFEIRCDAGYVVVPPSIHPSGTPYRWAGRAEDVRALPDALLTALRAVQAGDVQRSDGTRASAADVVFDEEIGAGGRNNALTRYAGRLLAKGIPESETLILVSAVNQAKCRPPLEQHEVNALVANIATREAKKRVTASGATLSLVSPEAPLEPPEDAAPAAPELPEPSVLAAAQVEGAKQLLTRDLAAAPVWAWSDLAALSGPMLPGDFVVVGSLMGNGKSTLLMSQMDAFAERRVATLYFPLEVDPEVCRLRWAAWKLNLDVRAVIRQDWRALPEGAQEAVATLLEEQAESPFIHFASPKRVTFATLLQWCRWGVNHGCRVVMLDHLHRMDFGSDSANQRVTITEVVRRLKDAARELGVTLIAAAQLNRSSDPVDPFIAPQLARLKETAAIGEEADVVLMLSRRLRPHLPDQWANQLRLGRLTEREITEPGVMAITCRKHRLDDAALNHTVLLQVVNGRLQNKAPAWREAPSYANGYQRAAD